MRLLTLGIERSGTVNRSKGETNAKIRHNSGEMTPDTMAPMNDKHMRLMNIGASRFARFANS